jgi:hypothetical protein
VVAAEAIDAGARHASTHVALRVARHDDRLIIAVEGTGPAEPFTHLADRVGAIGGSFAADRDRIRAELPCG